MSLLTLLLTSASRRKVLSLAFQQCPRLKYGRSLTLQRTPSFSASASSASVDQSLSSSSNNKTIPNSSNKTKTSKRPKKSSARDKRREFIGKAKAVDRGQWKATYQPGGRDGNSFQAKSGLPDRTRPYTVLGIESSCDDTGAAILQSDGVILGEALQSQHEIHAPYGGVVPGLARNAHVEAMDGVIEEALRKANMTSVAEVDAIGVTIGPGLEICLRVGCNRARELAMQHNKPFVGIHHLEAHILMARLPNAGTAATNIGGGYIPATTDTNESYRAMSFPFLSLLVSGGHCLLLECRGIGQYRTLGGTLDDSLGEAFDKTARLLGLPGVGGGGGPAVEQLAREGDAQAVPLPIPLQQRKDCDFSYAGLKTAVRVKADKMRMDRGLESIEDLSRQEKADIAASFQHVAICHVEQRLERAMNLMEQEGNIRSLAVVGGVAANKELRTRLEALCKNRTEPWQMVVPPPRLCTDQGSMSAWAAVERITVGSTDDPKVQEVFARFPFASSSMLCL